MKEFLDNLSSRKPVPGGGSVSAVSGALAASLGAMVCNLSDIPAEKMGSLRNDLQELGKKDEEAFKEVMKSYKAKNKEKKDKALKRASLVPLETAEKCLEVLEELEPIGKKGKKSAITDIGVGALLAYAGIEGAILNIKINHKYIRDEEFITKTTQRYEEVQRKGKDRKDAIMNYVEDCL